MKRIQKLAFSLALLLILPYSAYAAAQSNFYGVWVRGNEYYEINQSTITKTSIYSNDYNKAKYRIVKWEKSGNNGYIIYTLSEKNQKESFSVKVDAYSDVFINGNQMKKSSAAELNKAIRPAEAAKAARAKIEKAALANAAKLASLQSSISDSRDGKVYRTVKIGDQIWMATNLNYVADGSKCYGEGGEVAKENYSGSGLEYVTISNEEMQFNCVKYGRLYDWNSAMESCPSGWHLPTNEEWDKLYRYVDGSSGTESPYESNVVGEYLKAKSGWDSNGNGSDSYGFSALPGGFSDTDGFGTAGIYGFWWSASENKAYYENGVYYAYNRHMSLSSGGGYSDGWYSHNKSNLFSVRCVRGVNSDDMLAVKAAEEAIVANEARLVSLKGSFTDKRDGKKYKTVEIGEQTWMAENLNYETGSKCWSDKPKNCEKNGKLYDWNTAMKICPDGWHLPTLTEWEALSIYIENDKKCSRCNAKHLKAMNGWEHETGTDAYGFSALPGSDGFNNNDNCNGNWWTASKSNKFGESAWSMIMRSCLISKDNFNHNDYIHLYEMMMIDNPLGVRCLKGELKFDEVADARIKARLQEEDEAWKKAAQAPDDGTKPRKKQGAGGKPRERERNSEQEFDGRTMGRYY